MTRTLTFNPFTFDISQMDFSTIDAAKPGRATPFAAALGELTAGGLPLDDAADHAGANAGYDGLSDFGSYRSRILDLTTATMEFVSGLYTDITPSDMEFAELEIVELIDLERLDPMPIESDDYAVPACSALDDDFVPRWLF